MTSKIPTSMSFTDASVLPLAISTAAMGLYAKDNLDLPPPQVSPKPANKFILVWGGASSIGAVTIQLAKASGMTVITTASSHNLTAMTSQLGADHAFDYKSAAVINDVVSAAEKLINGGHAFAGVYDAISLPSSFNIIGQIFNQLDSGKLVSSKKMATVLPPSDLPGDIEAKNIFAALLVDPYKDVAQVVWEAFVPEALEKGVLTPLPPALVVGKGLELLQKGMDEQKSGVSFAKVVIAI